MVAIENTTAIIDYGAGNTKSVMNLLDRLGVNYVLTCDREELTHASRLILPGVGHAATAMQALADRDIIDLIRDYKKPFLGVCLGMQLMCRFSEEGDTDCLNLVPTTVKKLVPFGGAKVPHMGWNKMILDVANPLFIGLEPEEYMYFVHSYVTPVSEFTIGSCQYIQPFTAALQYENFYGVQFHPEKSGARGQIIFENFLKLN